MSMPINQPILSRRELLSSAGGGIGMLALSSLLRDQGLLASTGANARPPHQKPAAKSVIWLFMNGGPSGIDLFDHKPALKKWDGKSFPGQIETLFPYPGPIMDSPFRFSRHGECGATVSDVFPHLAQHVDKITFLPACTTEGQNHVPTCYMMNTGRTRFGAPSIGSWATYGLGSENRNFPSFIVMYDPRSAPEGGANLWDSGYLPGENQAVTFRASSSPILYLKRVKGLSGRQQQRQLELLRTLNSQHLAKHQDGNHLEARIQSFETAFRMQTAAPDLVNIKNETHKTQNLYGLDVPECETFGTQLLMARRMVERGVRFIQIYHGGWAANWDQHSRLERDHRKLCYETDKPIAGLLQDLQQRGLLDSTLVVWGGEFGRTPTSQDRDGRDHNPFGFTMWMAGGGIKRGHSHGQTDELGYKPVEQAVSMHDLHATVLHCLGLDHGQLTFRHSGREQSLTNGLGDVVDQLLI